MYKLTPHPKRSAAGGSRAMLWSTVCLISACSRYIHLKRFSRMNSWMGKLCLLLHLVSLLAQAQQPSVTITGTDSISHSVARVHFNVSATYNDVQTLITPTSYGSCASGTLPSGAGNAAWIQPITGFTHDNRHACQYRRIAGEHAIHVVRPSFK